MHELNDTSAQAARVPTVGDLPADVLAVMTDDSASHWLRSNLFELIARRDPLDSYADAQALAQALESWARHVYRLHGLEFPV